jgi:hypothetical protein
MPRHAFWVIVTGANATAFRAREREDLLPTLKQLQRTQPDAVLKWFERGRIWESPLQAAEARRVKRPSGPPRGRAWRPGGNHKDPRARFELTRDQKRAKFKRQLRGGPCSHKPEDSVSRPIRRRTKKESDE